MCEHPPQHWNLVFSFLAVAQLCSGDFPHVALWGIHALSRGTAYSRSRSVHHPVWLFSEVKRDKLTFLTATANCLLPPLLPRCHQNPGVCFQHTANYDCHCWDKGCGKALAIPCSTLRWKESSFLWHLLLFLVHPGTAYPTLPPAGHILAETGEAFQNG